MTRGAFLSWLIAGALVATSAAASAQTVLPETAGANGSWVNPRGTVKVITGNCDGKLCGWVSWASPQARSDAQAAGVKQLVGTELLRNYKTTDGGHWQGQVYVPDMGRTFYSTITQLNQRSLKISGCILGGLICKSQIWQRS